MPCFSTVTQTQITEASRLRDALKQLNIAILSSTDVRIETSAGNFTRQRVGEAFSFDRAKDLLAPIGRKYAELTVREWAMRNGMSVTGTEGQKISLQKRG